MNTITRWVSYTVIGLTLCIGSLSAEEKKVRPIRPALLVIDIQNQFLSGMADKDMALQYINGLIWMFRENGFPVIRVYHTDPKWGPKPGLKEFQFPESINIKDDDPKIVKNYPSAFKKTELDQTLKDLNCNTLFLCGLSATACVLATYHTAQDLDYNVFMVRDAIMSPKVQDTDFVEEVFNTVPWEAVQLMLESAK
jgi:nicotinamidase-related amidase